METTLATFDSANGREPLPGLVRDSAGNLCTAFFSGAFNDGTVFELSIEF